MEYFSQLLAEGRELKNDYLGYDPVGTLWRNAVLQTPTRRKLHEAPSTWSRRVCVMG